MTEVKAQKGIREILSGAVTEGLTLEIKKTKVGAALVVTDVLSVEEFCPERISLATHKGRILIHGTHLSISVYQKRCIEIFGKITNLELGYGKG